MRTLDPATKAGAHALERLETELAGWLTTVNPDGQPQSSVVWYVWRDGEVLVYSHVRAPRNGNIEANPRVAFNLDTTDDGDDYVTMEGETRIDRTMPPSSANETFQAKYRHMIDRYGWTPDWVSENYPVPIVIRPTRWRLPEPD
jgi:PPOX class probable F420-dependent enzyme